MLNLTGVNAQITQVQPRVERHGDEGVEALDVAVAFKLMDKEQAAALLTAFRLARYLPLLHNGDGTPAWPEISGYKVRHKLLDADVLFGVKGKAPLTLRGDMKKLWFDALPGGGIECKARVSFPNGATGAQLTALWGMWADGECVFGIVENQMVMEVTQ